MTLHVVLRCALALSVFTSLLLINIGNAVAQTRVERVQAAGDLVAEALHREVYGEHDDREALLHQALTLAPEFEAAHWHLGHVKENGKWVTFETAPSKVIGNLPPGVAREILMTRNERIYSASLNSSPITPTPADD